MSSEPFSPSAQYGTGGSMPVQWLTPVVVSVVSALTAMGISVWIIRDPVSCVMCAAADVLVSISAFLMGNSVRLRAARTHAGYCARIERVSVIETLSALPSQYVVSVRVRMARRSAYCSLATLLLALGVVFYSEQELALTGALATLSLVSSTVCYWCGMSSRPLG